MKKHIGVVGSNNATSSKKMEEIAFELGKTLVDNGFRIINGGMGGVMHAVSAGGKSSEKYVEGDIIGISPTMNKSDVNKIVDVPISTGMSYARNQIIIASSDVIVAVGGGAGTLSEIAYAWQIGKPIIAFDIGEGWSSKLAGTKIDNRRSDFVQRVTDVYSVIREIHGLFYSKAPPIKEGDQIDGYIVKSILSKHQNRYVYLVEKDRKLFVLKFHDFIYDVDKKRFENEIKILLSLDYPNIPKVLNYGHIKEEVPYHISPYLGKNLKIEYDNLQKEDIQNIIAQIEETIFYLKDKSCVHTDLKPENILISPDYKRISLIDFYLCERYDNKMQLEDAFKKETMYNFKKLKHFLETGERVYKI